jgi:multiple sugar transport system permease protein
VKKLAIYTVLGLWTGVCLFPFLWMAVTSLKSEAAIMFGPYYLPFVDFEPTLRAWRFIFGGDNDLLFRRFLNSLVVGSGATVLTMTLASLAVFALTRLPHDGRFAGLRPHAIFTGVLATRVLPPMVAVLPLYVMARTVGLIDTPVLLILVYTAVNLPVAFWLLRPVFGEKASPQEESAILDGASQLRILISIVLPMIVGGLAASGLIVFTLCWNEYLFAALLAGDHAMTLPPWAVGQLSMKEAQVGGDGEEWANFSAATLVIILPVLACTGIVQRFLGRLTLWSR